MPIAWGASVGPARVVGRCQSVQFSRSETSSQRTFKGWALSVNSNVYTLVQRSEPVYCTVGRAQQHAHAEQHASYEQSEVHTYVYIQHF